MDLGFNGPSLTWTNRQVGGRHVKELGLIMCLHCLILILEIQGHQKGSGLKYCERAEHLEFIKIVKEAWKYGWRMNE